MASSAPSAAESAKASPPGIRGGLEPGLCGGHALFESRDLRRMLEGEPDIVEAFDEAHAIGGRQLEGDVGTAGTADALGRQIDRERGGAIGGAHARLEG